MAAAMVGFNLKNLLCLLLLIGGGLPLLGFAQPNPGAVLRQVEDTQRKEQERQQRDLDALRQRNDKPAGIDTNQLAPKVTVPSAPGTCRQIDEITIEDAPHLTQSMRGNITKQFEQRCLGVGEIEQILGEITRDYLQRGYIAVRAYLPAQDLSTRKLRIVVVEGSLGKITIDDGNKHSISIGNIFPGLQGELLNLRDLEQGIEQINRLSSNNATMEIVPGDAAGVSDVVVHNQPASPYHLSLSLDNEGTKSTGKNQAAASGYVDNLLSFNEMLSATHRESVFGDGHGERSDSDTFNLSVPYGYFLFSYGLSYSTYESTVDLPSGLAEIANGMTRTHNALLDYVAYRDQSSRLSFSLGLTNKETKNYFADQFLAVSSRTLTILDFDTNLSTALGGGLARASVGYARGLPNLDALDDPAYLPSNAPHAQFEKYKYALSYSYPFFWGELPWDISSAVTGQHALDKLYGSEQLLIGGNYTVRGFVDTTLSGDNGYFWRNDLSVQPRFTLGGESFGSRLYLGVDYGEVSNLSGDAPEGHLSGWGMGAQLHWRSLMAEISNTRAISLPNGMNREGSQTWVRLSYSI
jgi:hemolysin activation/secretion protein